MSKTLRFAKARAPGSRRPGWAPNDSWLRRRSRVLPRSPGRSGSRWAKGLACSIRMEMDPIAQSKTSDQMSQIAPKHTSYTSFYTPSTKLQNFWSFLWAPISDPTMPAQNPRNPSCAQTREATSRMVTFAPTCVLSYRCINICCENKTCIKRFGSRAVLFGAGYFLVICCLSLLRRPLVAHQRLHGRSNSQPRNV